MIYRILALILLLATSAHANKWVRTNDVNGLTLNPATLTGTVGQVRITTFALDGSTPKDLTGLAAWLAVVDVEDSYSTITPAQIITPTNGHVIGLTSLEAGTYTARLMAGYSTNDSLAFPIAWETIVITNPPSAGASVSIGASTTLVQVAVSVTSGPTTVEAGIDAGAFSGANFEINQTFNYTGIVGIVHAYTNEFLPPTTNAGVVTVWVNTNGGTSGSGEMPPINGYRSTNVSFNASYPFTVSTVTNSDGLVITYGLSGNAGTIVIPSGNTATSEFTFVATNAQYYTAGATATQLYFFGISPAAGFSPGSFGQGFYPCTGSQVFAVYMAQGGLARTNAVAMGGWGYVSGGNATSTNGAMACSGAGSVAVLTGTNIVFHLGGPGGSISSGARTPAGGLIGGSLGLSTSGGPGTQTNHGAAATATAGATAGTSASGGNGTTAGGAYPGSGGGGGHFSGGGACGSGSLNVVSGGSGSSYVDALITGFTERSPTDSSFPPATSAPQYRSPYGVAIGTGGAITNFNRGNPSFLSIVSYPSP
jgi:hypothetical protein